MELVEIRRELAEIKKRIEDFSLSLKLDVKEERLASIENKMLDADFWNDNEAATKLVAESKFLKKELDEFAELGLLVEHNEELVEYLKDEEDEEMYADLLESQKDLGEKMSKFTMRLLLSEPYDNHSAIFEIHAGAGGVDAADCAEILLRMYERFFQKQGLKHSFLDYQAGDVCGIKSVTIKVEGDFAYGLLKGEKGVHRIVRISPFDSSGKRHTSFCSVDIVPEFEEAEMDIQISPDELKIDTYRASGAGGQHINTTDSAVRITHIPSGIVVQSQAERSQISNRETAMKELKSKLYQLKLDEQAKELSSIRGEQMSIGWGSQIKSYVFAPYTMVKDHRTSYEVATIDKVMDGEIYDFIDAYLHFNMNSKIED